MKGKSKASKTKQDKDSTMSSLTNAVELELPLFATAVSVQQNSETTSLDKLNLCVTSIQQPKSSKISALDSTSSAKDCKPYWSDLCAEINSKLLLPVATDCVDSDLNCSSLWSNKTVEGSLVLSNPVHSPQTELTADLLAILHVFSCRMHEIRSYSQKIKEDPNIPKP